MENNTSFTQIKKEYLNILKQYVPIVDRVHGANHPEFHEVRRIFENLHIEMEQTGTKKTELQEFFFSTKKLYSGLPSS